MARDQAAYDRAAALHTEALRLARDLNDRRYMASALAGLADVAAHQGDDACAADQYQALLILFQAIGYLLGIVETLEGLAGLAAAREQWERAARLWGAAVIRDRTGMPVPPVSQVTYDRAVAATRAALGDAAFAAAWDAGRRVPPDISATAIIAPVTNGPSAPR